MAASYPTSTKSFTTKIAGAKIYAADTNSMQEEIVAIETDLRAGLPIARGGTGETTAVDAINALVPAQGSSAGKYLKTDGSVVSWDSAGSSLPAQSAATTGQVLHSNGTTESWADTAYDNNYIIDGNFQVAQMVPTVATEVTNPGFGYPVFDMWRLYPSADGGTLPTLKHSQQLITIGSVPNSKYCYRINTNGAGSSLGANSEYDLDHMMEHGAQNLCGLNKELTLSFYARTTISGTKRLGLCFGQNYGTGGSPSEFEFINGTNVTLTSTWTKYTYTLTTNTLVGKTFGTNNDDNFQVRFAPMWGSNINSRYGASTAETFVGSGDIEVAQFQLCAGDTATTFMPRTFNDELRMCKRYLEKSYAYGTSPGTGGMGAGMTIGHTYQDNTQYALAAAKYTVEKRTSVQPTIYNPNSGTAGRVRIYTSTELIATAWSWGTTGFGDLQGSTSSTFTSKGELAFHWVCDARF